MTETPKPKNADPFCCEDSSTSQASRTHTSTNLQQNVTQTTHKSKTHELQRYLTIFPIQNFWQSLQTFWRPSMSTENDLLSAPKIDTKSRIKRPQATVKQNYPFSFFQWIFLLTIISLPVSSRAIATVPPELLSQLQIEKIALLRSQQSSCGLFNQFLSPRDIMAHQRAHFQGSIGQVQRSSEITLSFWASLDVHAFEAVYGKEIKANGRSGKISLFKIVNPDVPMVVDKSGSMSFKSHPPCPVDKAELLNNPEILDLENVRSNPNCFTHGIYEGAEHLQAGKSEQVPDFRI